MNRILDSRPRSNLMSSWQYVGTRYKSCPDLQTFEARRACPAFPNPESCLRNKHDTEQMANMSRLALPASV